MPTNADSIALLIFKYMTGQLSEQEDGELKEWISRSEANRLLFDELTDAGKVAEYSAVKKNFTDRWEGGMQARVVSIQRKWLKRTAVAAIIFIVAAGAYVWLSRDRQQPVAKSDTEDTRYKNDIKPGNFKAKLTLADGSAIFIDSTTPGLITRQGNTMVFNKDGKLVYGRPDKAQTEVLYNTLSTAKSETYLLTLSDGSRVWLNAASSITYPVHFMEKERKVKISGEVYFEVAHDATKPFIVTGGSGSSGKAGWAVQVLGTVFNINAYDDEAVTRTTLLEGKVKVTATADSQLTANEIRFLSPGQQAQIKTGTIHVTKDASIPETVAWKNGMFLYESANIENIMKQVARWYDVEVFFEGKIDQDFRASIPRNVSISRLLRILEMTGKVHFKIDGKRVMVMQ